MTQQKINPIEITNSAIGDFLLEFMSDIQDANLSSMNKNFSKDLNEKLASTKNKDAISAEYFARIGKDNVLLRCCSVLTEGTKLIADFDSAVAKILDVTNRKFLPHEIRPWFIARLREFRDECLRVAEERRSQGLPVTPLPDGVTLPELPSE